MSILIKNALLRARKKDIYISNGIIEQISHKISIEAEYKINASNLAILPSFFNSHTHSAMSLLKGYAEDLKLDDWLNNYIWPVEAKMKKKHIYHGSKLAMLEMIKSGTTGFNDMYWHPEQTAKAAKELGMNAFIGLTLLDFDKKGSRSAVMRNYTALKNKANLAVAPHAIYTVSKENLLWAKDFAEKHNLPLHIHVSETKHEVNESIKKNKARPVEYLNKIGFFDTAQPIILAHAVWLDAKEAKILSKHSSITIAYNAASNMKLSSGTFNYKLAKKNKLNVALGTDGSASNNSLNMIQEMKTAALLQKLKHGPDAITAKETFNMATINPANAFKQNTGKIEEGKDADIILVRLASEQLLPNTNLIANIVYAADSTIVDTAISKGKILMLKRKLKIADETEIKHAAEKSAHGLLHKSNS